jgi:TRAP transporter TAXI family solute receptor
MKRLICVSLFLCLFLIQTVWAENIIISTGSKKGNYFKFGLRIAKLLQAKGYPVTVVNSKGSVENLERLIRKEAHIAIVQKDALAWFRRKKPETEGKIDTIAELRDECVFVVARKDGKVEDDGDLQETGVKIATGKIGSGSNVTWNYMCQLEKGFKKATSIPKGGTRAINKVLNKEYDAYLFVLTPDPENKLIKLIANNDELTFIPVTDWDLNDKLDGKPIYKFEKVVYQKGFFDKKVKTICTSAIVVASTDLDDDLLDDLSDILLEYKSYILNGE